MAFYAFLMQLDRNLTLTETDVAKMTTISEIGGAMSVVCCVLTLSLLCFLPIKNDGLFIVGNMSLVLIAAQLSFIGSESTGYPDPIMCKVATCLLHYFFLCVNFASLAYAMHLWSKFGPVCIQACRRKAVYVCVTWLLPGIIVCTTVFVRGDKYAKEQRCWLPSEQQTRLSFLLPLAFIQLVNWTLYFLILRASTLLDIKKAENKAVIIRHAVLSSLSMFAILGLQWILGFTVTLGVTKFLQYLFVILASGQGLFLLIFHVLPNSQIQKALCSKIAEHESSTSTPTKSAPVTEDSQMDEHHGRESEEMTIDSHVECSNANMDPAPEHPVSALSVMPKVQDRVSKGETESLRSQDTTMPSKAKSVSFAMDSPDDGLTLKELDTATEMDIVN